jgi:hypothetical protein
LSRQINLLHYLILNNPFLRQQLDFDKGKDLVYVPVQKSDNVFDLGIVHGENLSKLIILIRKNIKDLQLPDIDKCGCTLIQNLGEGDCSDLFFSNMHELIEILNLQGKIIVMNSAINGKQLYDRYLETYHLERKFQFVPCEDSFGNPGHCQGGQKIYNYFSKIMLDENLAVKKLFCNFNLKARKHRSGMVAILQYYGLIDNNYITTPVHDLHKENIYNEWRILIKDSNDFLKDLVEKNMILEKIKTLEKKYPLRIDNRIDYIFCDKQLFTADSIYRARQDSLIELVSESNVSGPHFFTEKTFMPISLCKPFITVNSFKALESLRQLGYQTFAPYINESYDNIQDNAERCMAIAQELVRLKQLRIHSPGTFYLQYNKLLEIARENKKIFLSKADTDTLKNFDDLYFD